MHPGLCKTRDKDVYQQVLQAAISLQSAVATHKEPGTCWKLHVSAADDSHNDCCFLVLSIRHKPPVYAVCLVLKLLDGGRGFLPQDLRFISSFSLLRDIFLETAGVKDITLRLMEAGSSARRGF